MTRTNDPNASLSDPPAFMREESTNGDGPTWVSSLTRGLRPSIVALRLSEVESVEYVAGGNRTVVTMKSGRFITITDERALPMFDALQRLMLSEHDCEIVQPPPPPEGRADGRRNDGTATAAKQASQNNEQMPVRRENMPLPPGLAANAQLGDTAGDSRKRS